MSKIDDYNDALKGLDVLGLTLTAEQQVQLQKMLDEIISDEILPAISEKIAPLLLKIKSPLTLVIDHVPGQDIALRSTQKQVEIEDVNSKSYRLVPYEKQQPSKKNKVTKKPAPATLLRVTFKDGTSFCEEDSNKTMVAVVEHLGLKKVMDGAFTCVGKQIVSDHNPHWPGVFQVGDFYIYTSASNKDKIKALTKVCKALGKEATFTTLPKPTKKKK